MRLALRGLARGLLWALLLACGAALAATVQYVYDDLGRLVAAIDASGQTTVYAYDAAGNLLSVSGNASTRLSVVAFSPSHGKEGDSVTIIGSAFVANPAQNTVSFNGTPAAVSTATATTLVAVVPAGATSGPISVSNLNGTATSANAFTVVQAPVITAVTPGAVGRGGATRVEISGSNLAFATAVTFTQAGVTATILPGATGQLLPVRVDVLSSVPAGAYGFSVTSAAGTTDSGAVTLSVGVPPTGEVMTVARPASVFMPQSAQLGPTPGDSMTVANPVSVFLPPDSQLPPPAGAGMSVTQPVSVSMP